MAAERCFELRAPTRRSPTPAPRPGGPRRKSSSTSRPSRTHGLDTSRKSLERRVMFMPQIPGGLVVSIVGIINGLINAILPQLGALLPGLPH